MALPKLNSSPSYETVVPSTGQKILFRPFLVKEQKNLLIAMETQDRKDLVRAIIDTIQACSITDIEGELTTFDVDYLFTMIRAKSVGESSDVSMSCTECGTDNTVKVQIDTVELSSDIKDAFIPITEQIKVKMKYPTYEEFLGNEKLFSSTSFTESLLELIIVCMDSILTEEERFSIKDESKEEVINFIESMTSEQFEKIAEFVTDIPAVSQTGKFNCSGCGKENDYILKGMDDFF